MFNGYRERKGDVEEGGVSSIKGCALVVLVTFISRCVAKETLTGYERER